MRQVLIHVSRILKPVSPKKGCREKKRAIRKGEVHHPLRRGGIPLEKKKAPNTLYCEKWIERYVKCARRC